MASSSKDTIFDHDSLLSHNKFQKGFGTAANTPRADVCGGKTWHVQIDSVWHSSTIWQSRPRLVPARVCLFFLVDMFFLVLDLFKIAITLEKSFAQTFFSVSCPMPTITEVAKKAGVSPSTVSHVVNNTRFVSILLRQRVQAAMIELGYRPNTLARSLRRGETHTIGLILPDSSNPYFAEIAHAIETAAFEQEYSVVLCSTANDQDKERLYTEVLENKQVDGIIFVAAGQQTDTLRDLIQKKTPVVLVDRDLLGVAVDTVFSDNLLGGRLATQHLIDSRHTRIGCITGPSHLTASSKRVAGYRDTLTEAHIRVDENLIIRGDFHPESGRLAASQLLALSNPPTAIFACNDLMAVGALRAAMELGYRVPEDLAVVGYDDIELASYTTPPLTTVQQPKQEIGQATVEILINRIRDAQFPPQHLSVPVSLVVRGSSQALKLGARSLRIASYRTDIDARSLSDEPA